MFVLLFITLFPYSCHGQQLQKSRWKPSQPPFRAAVSCREDESVCNLYGYDSESGITNVWMPHYYGCIDKKKERECCPPGWKYNHKSFYMEDAPEITCIIGDETFIGGSEEHGNRKFCTGDSKVSCRIKNSRPNLTGSGKFIQHYIHRCQDKSDPCNGECYKGYKKKYTSKNKVLECKTNQESRDLEDDDNDDDDDDFHETTEGIIVFSLIGVVVMAVIAIVITIILLRNKKKKEKAEYVEANPDYGLADNEDNIEFRDTNIDYFLPSNDGVIEVVDYNDEYGRASLDDGVE